MIRLTTQCNSGCAHCTIADIAHHPDRSPRDVLEEMKRGAAEGCTELVFMRGEATIHPAFMPLVRNARKLGYRHIQVQTNARILVSRANVQKIMHAGVNFFEVSFFGDTAELHDRIDGSDGAFNQASAALTHMRDLNCERMVTVPVVKRNYLRLNEIVDQLRSLGVPRIQFNFTRPVKVGQSWQTAPLVRLSEATPWIRRAMAYCEQYRIISETEGVPLCHLAPEHRMIPDSTTDFSAQQVSDVHRKEDSVANARSSARPMPAVCQDCALSAHCPTTWAAYQQLYGTWEFTPIA
jgi:MoaA/NifB/PqqE/SkfB family radical SAM enzyme